MNPSFLLRILVSSAFFVFTVQVSVAQGLGNSPYSSYGIGETYSGGFAPNQMMGGAGVAASNGIYLNNLNPALLARNRNVTFEVGVLGQYKRLKYSGKEQRTAGANLNYVTLGFPINRRWSASIGLQPYSYIDYQSSNVIPTNDGSGYVNVVGQTGKGGLNRVAITNGFQITNNLYVGLSAGYLFGTTTVDKYVSTQGFQNGLAFGTPQYTRRDRINYHDVLFKGGLAWRQKLKDKLYLTLAGTADLGTRISADQLITNEQLTSGLSVPGFSPDTVNRTPRGKGYVQLSPTYRVGFALENPYKLTFAADFSYQRNSQFRDFGDVQPRGEKALRDSYTVAVGAEYTPDVASATSYFKRIPYRIGASYGTLPYGLNGKQSSEWTVTTGVSMPLGRGGLSDMNLGLQYGNRGSSGGQLIREQYGRVILGFTLNDRWFQRLVID